MTTKVDTATHQGEVCWLHISDLHFTDFGDNEFAEDLTRDVTAVVNASLRELDFVFVTGDLSFSGTGAEFERAGSWLTQLANRLGVQADRLYLVPGNHDVERSRVQDNITSHIVHKHIRGELASGECRSLDTYLRIENAKDLEAAVFSKLKSFEDFARRTAYSISPERPFWVRDEDTGLGVIRVVGLNSVLASFDDGDAPGNLAFGKRQLREAGRDDGPVEEGPLTIVLAHHPPRWMLDGETLQTRLKLLPHLILVGHLHKGDVTMTASLVQGQSLVIAAGAGYGQDSEHCWYAARLRRDGLELWFRKWSKDRQEYVPDMERAPNGGRVRLGRTKLPDAMSAWLGKQLQRRARPRAERATSMEVLRAVGTCEGHEGYVYRVVFLPGGAKLASAAADQVIRVWDVRSWRECEGPYKGHSDTVTGLVVTSDGRFVISSSRDKKVVVWQRGGGVHRELLGHDGWVYGLASSPDGRLVFSGGNDRLILKWDLERGDLLARMEGHEDNVNYLDVSPDGRRLFSASKDGTIRVWDVEDGTLVELGRHDGKVLCVRICESGSRLLTGGEDCLVKLWDLSSMRLENTYRHHEGTVNSVLFLRDDLAISGGRDHKIVVFGLRDGRILQTLSGQHEVNELAKSPKGDWVAFGCDDRLVHVLQIVPRISTGLETRRL